MHDGEVSSHLIFALAMSDDSFKSSKIDEEETFTSLAEDDTAENPDTEVLLNQINAISGYEADSLEEAIAKALELYGTKTQKREE